MKKKNNFDQPEKTVKVEVPTNASGFLNGLVLGAVAGAAGFFLYGTKKGRKLSKNLVQKAEKLKKDLEEIKQSACCDCKNTKAKPKSLKTKIKAKANPKKTPQPKK